MRECLVLTPGLFDLGAAFARAAGAIFHDGENAELHAAETLSGFDLAFRTARKRTPALTSEFAQAAAGLSIARIVFNNEVLLENAAPEIAFGPTRVKPPPHAFLQASAAGEAALQARVLEIVAKARTVLDLFAAAAHFHSP